MRSLKDVFGYGSGKTVYRSACKKLQRPYRAVLAPRRDNFKATAYTSTCFARFTEIYAVLIEALRLLIASHVVQGRQVAAEEYKIRTLGDRTYAPLGGVPESRWLAGSGPRRPVGFPGTGGPHSLSPTG